MVAKEVKPTNVRGVAASKGTLTWLAIIGFVLFALLLGAAILRPVIARHDGPASAEAAVRPSGDVRSTG